MTDKECKIIVDGLRESIEMMQDARRDARRNYPKLFEDYDPQTQKTQTTV